MSAQDKHEMPIPTTASDRDALDAKSSSLETGNEQKDSELNLGEVEEIADPDMGLSEEERKAIVSQYFSVQLFWRNYTWECEVSWTFSRSGGPRVNSSYNHLNVVLDSLYMSRKISDTDVP